MDVRNHRSERTRSSNIRAGKVEVGLAEPSDTRPLVGVSPRSCKTIRRARGCVGTGDDVVDQGRDGPRQGAELTGRGLALGTAIIAVFMAANMFLGLKTGMTFSSSIPATLISMGCLRLVGGGILENNIVQTQASAAGTLCNVILVLPGLVLIGQWQGFPFWQTSAVCGLGGLLGVAFSIPLRRALVVRGNLPYPEGTAAAEVLHAGEAHDGGAGLRDLGFAAAASGLIAVATGGLKLLGDGVSGALTAGGAVFRFGTGFSLALVGVGYLIGIGACLALLTGVVLAWGVAVPLLTAFHGPGAAPSADAVWADQVRLIGAGIMGAGGLWTVARLAAPILGSLRDAVRDARGGSGSRPTRERDLPITGVAVAVGVLALLLAVLFGGFVAGQGLGRLAPALVVGATLFAVVVGFLMASACGYLAGLLGSSSSPISGIGILTTMAAALPLALLLGHAGGERFAAALALLAAAVIVTASSIANDNLQDLKTGQIVGATPWRQQVALVVGVAIGAPLIAPLLGLLYNAYGFVGALPRPGMDAGAALPAPQAALVTQIARGILGGTLPWTPVLVGVVLGAVLVGVEERLRRRNLTYPALSVGIGMYLPLSVEVTIAIGGLLAWASGRALARQTRDEGQVAAVRGRGVRLASGFLVGESLTGVALAEVDAAAGHGGTLTLVGPGFAPVASGLGALVFAGALATFFRLVSRPVRSAAPGPAAQRGTVPLQDDNGTAGRDAAER